MKKILLACLAAVAVLTMAACNNQSAAADSVVQDVTYPQVVGFEDYDTQHAIRESNPVAESFVSSFDSCKGGAKVIGIKNVMSASEVKEKFLASQAE